MYIEIKLILDILIVKYNNKIQLLGTMLHPHYTAT